MKVSILENLFWFIFNYTLLPSITTSACLVPTCSHAIREWFGSISQLFCVNSIPIYYHPVSILWPPSEEFSLLELTPTYGFQHPLPILTSALTWRSSIQQKFLKFPVGPRSQEMCAYGLHSHQDNVRHRCWRCGQRRPLRSNLFPFSENKTRE